MKFKKAAAALCAAVLSMTAVSFSAFAADTGVKIDETNFPGERFRKDVSDKYDTDHDGILSDSEISNALKITFYGDYDSYQGIEYLTNISELSVDKHSIPLFDFDLLPNLQSVSLQNCYTDLDFSGNPHLRDIFLFQIMTPDGVDVLPLDLKNNTELEELILYGSGVTTCDISNCSDLKTLTVKGGDKALYDSLCVSDHTNLESLCITDLRLKEIDLSKNTALKNLICFSNDLTVLDISNNPYLLKAYTEGQKEEGYAGETVNYIYDGDPDSDENEDYYELMVDSETKIITEKADTDVVAIDETNFPDENFREIVKEFDTDENGSLSEDEIAAVTEIDCWPRGISSIKGIEYFMALTYLDCSSNQLTELDVSNNTRLTYLNCELNDITTLDVSKNTALTELYCYGNQLTELNVNNTALEKLHCDDNQLTALDVSDNTALTELDCSRNQITELDVSKNTALVRLECADNKLTALDVSKNTELEILSCDSNKLKELDVRNCTELIDLYCGNDIYDFKNRNEIVSLDISNNTKLVNLGCYNNKIEKLDVSNNNVLETVQCGGNKLTTFDISKCPDLRILQIHENQLTSLDICNNQLILDAYYKGEEKTTGNDAKWYIYHYSEDFYDYSELVVDPKVTIIAEAPKPEEKPVTLTDEKTKVTVAGALDGLKLNVKPADVKDAVAAYDITLTDADNKVVQPSGKIEISIPCETKGLYVYHIKDDGTKEYIESKYVDGCYVFTADHLSVYALMKDKSVTTPEENKPENKPEQKPSTGDTKPADDSNKPTGSAAGIAFAGIALAGAALMVSKKRK